MVCNAEMLGLCQAAHVLHATLPNGVTPHQPVFWFPVCVSRTNKQRTPGCPWGPAQPVPDVVLLNCVLIHLFTHLDRDLNPFPALRPLVGPLTSQLGSTASLLNPDASGSRSASFQALIWHSILAIPTLSVLFKPFQFCLGLFNLCSFHIPHIYGQS